MKRKAVLYRKSKDGKKAFYIDVENAESILYFLKSDEANLKKFRYALDLLLEGRPPRDLYDKENFDKSCEHVTAIKLFKGKKNPRIYCLQYTDGCTKVFVIIAAELLEKKKSEGLTNKEKTIINRVASYQYTLVDETE
ncbi:MAG: hypothetical protein F9K37_07980 [Bacteroidales bacterium]|nr:MAG: hypothetical protein F9K37_07980 [Bacteroidales bacterium]